jgi:hypothetical protein
MHRIALVLVFVCGTGCGLFGGEAAKSALEVIAPTAVDAITRLVKDRWGSEAEVDIDTAACVPSPRSDSEWWGDDDDDFVYARCRGKAIE